MDLVIVTKEWFKYMLIFQPFSFCTVGAAATRNYQPSHNKSDKSSSSIMERGILPSFMSQVTIMALFIKWKTFQHSSPFLFFGIVARAWGHFSGIPQLISICHQNYFHLWLVAVTSGLEPYLRSRYTCLQNQRRECLWGDEHFQSGDLPQLKAI